MGGKNTDNVSAAGIASVRDVVGLWKQSMGWIGVWWDSGACARVVEAAVQQVGWRDMLPALALECQCK